MERISRNGSYHTESWTQNYNPYTDGYNNSDIDRASNAAITQMSFVTSDESSFIITNNSDFNIMPKTIGAVDEEYNTTTRIYVKAEDYYHACI